MTSPFPRTLSLALTLTLLTSCAVGPDYQRPSVAVPSAFKETQDWVPAVPADTLERGPWWSLFADPVLNQLAAQVAVSNQNVAAAVAGYAQARAWVREQRAGFFPTVNLSAGASRSGSSGGSSSANNSAANGNTGNSNRANSSYQISLGGSWEPDVWGRLSRSVDNASATAQASAADLAAARLAAQGELVVNYLALRQTDVQIALVNRTLAGYQRGLEITQNRYRAGIAPQTDVLQAQTQLRNTQADLASLQGQRARLEHACAVLVGQAPGNFAIAPQADWSAPVPAVPVSVPSTLLQRRPDIAAAERRVAAANAQIGVAQSAYYPNLSLSASVGQNATRVADLFSVAGSVWALGLSAAQTLFNAGATAARIEGSEAAYAQTVARYRQTVLTAFQDVEDQLSATRVLQTQQTLRQQASEAADQVEQQILNRYRAGQVNYTEVITAQASALSARRALVQAQADRQSTAVALIQALGGGWQGGGIQGQDD